MADEVTVDPVSGPESSESASGPWAELGFDSPDDLVKEFTKLKGDIGKIKPDARKAKELEAELEKYRQAEEERKAAEMSELEKREAALEKARSEQAKLQAELEETRKGIVYERAVAKRLGNYDEASRELVRELYDAKASRFADEDELAELLDDIDTKWKAHLDGLTAGGSRPDVGGGTRGRRQPPTIDKDSEALAAKLKSGGIGELLRTKYGK